MPFSTTKPIVQVESSNYATYLLTQDGEVYFCGFNSSSFSNFFGNTSISSSIETPTLMNIPRPVKAISANSTNFIALTIDNTVFATGRNNVGQLGLGTTSVTPLSVPTQILTNIPGNPVIKEVMLIHQAGIVVTADDDIYVFGSNDSGQIPYTTATYSIPIKITSFT